MRQGGLGFVGINVVGESSILSIRHWVGVGEIVVHGDVDGGRESIMLSVRINLGCRDDRR